LKTQSFEFDPENITKVTGDYIHTTSLNIPKELPGQNKWVMFEGPVLENDLIAYRFYGDSRNRSDIYGKKVQDLVMDTVSWNYHNLMDWGSDILKVGNSLGIGAPGVYYKDTIYTLSEWDKKTINVERDDTKMAVFNTEFDGLKFDDFITDGNQKWSIKAGELWTEVTVDFDQSLPEGAYFATGIVKHLEDFVEGGNSSMQYLYTWGTQSYHDQELGMGLVVDKKYAPRKIEDELSHLWIFENAEQSVTYRFLAAWPEGVEEIKSAEDFENYIRNITL